MRDSSAPRAVELTAAEQHAAWVMVRFAAEVGYRGLRWSIPNDASWRQPFLAAVPVHYDGLLADTYELRSQRRFGSSAKTVCALVRREEGFEALGVPGEEWLRPLPSVVEPRSTPTANAEPLADPWLPVEPADADQVVPRRDRRGRHSASTVRPRRRAAAAALGLLVPAAALGGGLVVANAVQQGPLPAATPAPPVPAPVQPSEVPALPAGGAQWVTEARVVLASVHEQLDVLTEAEQAWNAMPAERRIGEPPAPVRDLVDSRSRLEQQRAVLEADLAAWQTLQQTTASLEETEAQLAKVSRALQLGGQTAAGEQLREQRDMLIRQRVAQREQLAGWSARMDAAVVDPLRDPPDVEPIAESVIAMTEEPSALTEPAEPAEPDDSASVAVVGKEPEADRPQSGEDLDDDSDDPADDTFAPQQAESESEMAVDVANAPVAEPDTAPDDTLDMTVSGSIDVNISGVIDISITDADDETTEPDDETTEPDDETTEPDETTDVEDETTDIEDETTEPDETTDVEDETTEPDDGTTDVGDGEIEPGTTPANGVGTIDIDGADNEDIDDALDRIKIDMTLEDIQVQIDGQTVAIDVVIDGMGITVDIDQLTESPGGSTEDAAPTLTEAPSTADQLALGAGHARG